MKRRWTEIAGAVLKVMSLAVCVALVLGGKHPPARAQTVLQPVITTEDALQDDRQATMKGQLQGLYTRTGVLEASVAGMQGEERGIGALLALLQIGSIIFQVRGGRKNDS